MAIKNCASCSVRKQTVRKKEKKKEKRGGSLIGVFPPRIAVTHGKGRKRQSTHTKKYTCTIYKRVPRNDETPIHHTPLLFFFLFFPSPPLRSWANTRRHDGDAPCVTVSLSRIYLGFFFLSLSSRPPFIPSFPEMKHAKVRAHKSKKINIMMNLTRRIWVYDKLADLSHRV